MNGSIRLIVGLGNPGLSYRRTRHNIGREFIDYLSDVLQQKFSHTRQSEALRLPVFFGERFDPSLWAVKFDCYMNQSGIPAKQWMDKESLTPDQMLVLVDDFMIPFGSLRLRPGGSSGGHNGLKSIEQQMGTPAYPRLRVGVGPVPEHQDPADFVLEKFKKSEQEKFPQIYEIIGDTLLFLQKEGMQKAMSFANKQHF